tara:strand:+ start:1996 stop:2874 length:879 start_codon:yes stop_codon:yes gene_type:complete
MDLVTLATGFSSLASGFFGRRSANKQRREAERQAERRWLEYEIPGWEMQRDRVIANRDEQIRGILLQVANEKKLAEFKDANNLKNYKHALQIHQWKHQNQLELYRKSEELFGRAVESAGEQAQIELEENAKSNAFKNEELAIEGIIARGEARAGNKAGVSAAKAAQAQLADQGRQIEILTQNLMTANRDTSLRYKAAIEGADAQRMLRPTAPPRPLKPSKTPLADYQFPRELEEFDFGVRPIKNTPFVPVPSMGSVMAAAFNKGFSTFANQYQGTDQGGYRNQNEDPGSRAP